ncbi:hypothetical protein C8J56DRAFT_1113066 [Mycena floridula]|nr:hypothetical protein C8J56DRAFT_1113066 [Mycena floridula]
MGIGSFSVTWDMGVPFFLTSQTMEAVGFASSIIALTEAASTVFKYIKDIKDSLRDRAELQRSLASLPGLLLRLNAQFDSSDPNDVWSTETLKLAIKDGPFDQLHQILQKVEKKLDIAASRTGKLLDKAEATNLLQQVERVKTFVMLAIQNDHLALSRAIYQDVQQINICVGQVAVQTTEIARGTKQMSGAMDQHAQQLHGHMVQVTDELSEIATGDKQIQAHNMNLRAFSEWLSPIDFQMVQQNHFAKCAPGTGHWLPADLEFKRWAAGQIKTLWCPGNHDARIYGGGSSAESVLSQDVAVTCIFFDYNTSSSHSIANIFGGVIRQLFINCSYIPDPLELLRTSFQSGASRPTSLSAMVEALQGQIQLYSRVYLVVDALDECSINIRDDFVSKIRSLTKSGHLNVLITSRHISAIAKEFTNETRIDLRVHDDDVLSYINYRINQESRLKTMIKRDATLEREIVTQVTQKSAGMFLLVRLHVDSLASKNNPKALRDALATLPKDIHRSYDDTMARIMAQGEDDANFACQVFLWLTYAQERLTVEQLQHALAISPGMTDMNPDAITDIEILTSVCGGLVILEDNHWGSCYPRLVHYTTQEYFIHEESHKYSRDKEMEEYFELSRKYLSSDLFAHFHIVATCVTHLAFEGLKPARFWPYHAGQCQNMLCSTPRMAALLQNYLEDGFKVPSPLSSRFQGLDHHPHSGRVLRKFGLLQLTSMLVDRGVPINSKDLEKRTVLFHAVQKGHVDMVKWLLVAANEIGLPHQPLFNINDADQDGRTLLHHASDGQHLAIAEFLFSLPGINANVADKFGQTPYLISQQKDVDPNSYDDDCNSPLYYAIDNNRVDNVRILLRLPNIDLGPFQPPLYRVHLDSPLKFAAERGYVDIVDLLLKYPDIDPNWKGAGYTPLAYAIMRGHFEVVNLLLQHSDIQPNLMSGPPYYKWVVPPLSYAVGERTMEIMKGLLQHLDLDINCRDSKGLTPLSWAALKDYEKGVEFLLQHPHIQPDIPDEMEGAKRFSITQVWVELRLVQPSKSYCHSLV